MRFIGEFRRSRRPKLIRSRATNGSSGRRSFAVIGLLAAACSRGPAGPPGPAGPAGGTPPGYLSVLDFGAKTDMPSVDSTASFQAALDAAEQADGGTVWVPKGRFWFSGNIHIGRNVALAGAGIGPYDPYLDPVTTSVAPTLLPTSTSGQAFISIQGENSALQDVLVWYPNQTRPDASGADTTGPTVYPPTVVVSQPSKIFRCTFGNSYIAIEVMIGRVYLEDLHIGGFKNDIVIDHSEDFVHISHITASVFWDIGAGLNPPQPIDTWVIANSVSLTSYRQDALDVVDYDVFYRHTGITFLDSPQGLGVTWGVASNVDLDTVLYGVIAKSLSGPLGFVFSNLVVSAANLHGGNMIWLPAGGNVPPKVVVEGGSLYGTWEQPLKVEAGTLRVRDVIGLDPIGHLPALGIPEPLLPASGVPYVSNLPADAQVTITGGSVQDVIVDGASTGLTSGTFDVSPGVSIAVSYTAAPVWHWFVD